MSDTPKKRGRGRPPKPEGELRTHQLRVLRALHANRADAFTSGLSIMQLERACKVSDTILKVGIGATDPKDREAQDTKLKYRSLLSRGMVKIEECPERGLVYYLTQRGHAAVQKYAEQIADLDRPQKNGRTRAEKRANS